MQPGPSFHMAAFKATSNEKLLVNPTSDTWLDGDKNKFCSGIVKMEKIPVVTLAYCLLRTFCWRRYNPPLTPITLKSLRPERVTLICNDKDGTQSVIRIIKFGVFFTSGALHLQMRKL